MLRHRKSPSKTHLGKEVDLRFLRHSALFLLIGVLFTFSVALPTDTAEAQGPPFFTIDWGTLGWSESDPIPVEVNTYFDPVDHSDNPFHGLAGAAGGTAGFQSQVFTNVAGSGVDLTISYSPNMHDQSAPFQQGPNLYGPTGGGGVNPDCDVTGEWTLRATRDIIATRTPFTVVMTFSEDVYLDELIIGSLSRINGGGGIPIGYESSTVRAFDGSNATGNVVGASDYHNISDLADDSSLLHNLGSASCHTLPGPPFPNVPLTVNALTNVNMDPDLTYDAGGQATNLGTVADNGVYRAIGVGLQTDDRYGRVLLSWQTTPIRSVAFSTWVTPGPNDFGTTNNPPTYNQGFHSVTFAPFTFSLPITPPATGDTGGGSSSSSGSPATLPEVGFAPGVVSSVPEQPAELAYKKYGELSVAVPSLNVDLPILGVPLQEGEWDTSWLVNQAGYLTGTAFPTWEGNTVLASHVFWANGLPGPFANIDSLNWGDEIVINAWGQRFVYEVRTVKDIRPWDLSVLEKDDGYDWVTLLTCNGYDERYDKYLWRTAVQAVLVDVDYTR